MRVWNSARIRTGAAVLHSVRCAGRQCIASFGISHVQYADDTQLYIALGCVNAKMNIRQLFSSSSTLVLFERSVAEPRQIGGD